MHTSVSQAATALAASPLASRHSCARGVVAPAVAARRTRCAAPCRASMGAFAAAAPSDGGATTAWVVGQAVAATAILGAYFVFTQPASSQSRVDAEVRRRRITLYLAVSLTRKRPAGVGVPRVPRQRDRGLRMHALERRRRGLRHLPRHIAQPVPRVQGRRPPATAAGTPAGARCETTLAFARLGGVARKRAASGLPLAPHARAPGGARRFAPARGGSRPADRARARNPASASLDV
jgi:hypothetical protein